MRNVGSLMVLLAVAAVGCDSPQRALVAGADAARLDTSTGSVAPSAGSTSATCRREPDRDRRDGKEPDHGGRSVV